MGIDGGWLQQGLKYHWAAAAALSGACGHAEQEEAATLLFHCRGSLGLLWVGTHPSAASMAATSDSTPAPATSAPARSALVVPPLLPPVVPGCMQARAAVGACQLFRRPRCCGEEGRGQVQV